MLRELVELWPGGPSVTLGLYLILFRYVFVAAFLGWAVGILRWPTRRWLVSGSLTLAALSWLAFNHPLGRPYGLVEGERTMSDLGNAMVAAARADASEGEVVGMTNPSPLWGWALGLVSAFRPERLLRLYSWLPLFATLALGLAVAWWTSSLRTDSIPGQALPGLAVFFVLFLSGSRLSFLHHEGAFWPAFLWSTPQVGFAMAGALLFLRALSARSAQALLLAGLALAAVGWMSVSLAVGLAIASVAFVAQTYRTQARLAGVRLGVVVVGLLSFLPFRIAELGLAAGQTDSMEVASEILALTLGRGLFFALVLVGVVRALTGNGDRERFLGWAATTSFPLWLVVLVAVGRCEASRWLGSLVLVVMSVGAAYGTCWLLGWLERLGVLESKLPAGRLGLAGIVVLSLPFCFPYWWYPVRMDATYVASLHPIGGNYLAMGQAFRERTEADAIVAAGPAYASWIPPLSGRRILLAADELVTDDRPAREQALEWMVFSNNSNRIETVAREWGITHVAWGRLDQPRPGEEGPAVDFSFFDGRSDFEKVWRLHRWLTIYAYDVDR